MANRTLVLANLGTPKAPTPEAVREFLVEFLADPLVVDYPKFFWRPILERLVLRHRPARIAEAYRSIWRAAGSPLEDDTLRLVAAVRERLHGEWNVIHAFRYGERCLARVVDERLAVGDVEIVVVPLFPQRTSSSSGSIVVETQRIARERELGTTLRVIALRPDSPGYIEALADRVRGALGDEDVDHLLVSFHGIPVRYDRRERGLYQRDCRATTEALLARLQWPSSKATLAYQSRFGPEPWIGPGTAEKIVELARGGRSLAVVTPGFLTDGLETLEEIGIRGREAFEASGGKRFVVVRGPADHPRLAEDLAALVRQPALA